MIAKKRVKDATELLAQSSVSLNVQYKWVPFLLNPRLPSEGISLAQYYDNQYGPSRYPAMELPNLQSLEPSITWKVYEPSEEPNVGTTLHAHRLVYWAGQRFGPDAADRVMDELNQLYFVEAGLLSSFENLVGVVKKVGLDVDESQVLTYLESAEDRDRILRQDSQVKSVTRGVPHIVAKAGSYKKQLQLGSPQQMARVLQSLV